MTFAPRFMRAGSLLLSGAALGAAGGYAARASGTGLSPAQAPATAAKKGKLSSQARLRRAVELTAVVPDGHGSFTTISIERGTIAAISGDQLTLNEGNRRFTYKTVTVTLPSSATVRLSRKPSSLSALAAGDRVEVLQGPKRTAVIARPASATSTPLAG